MQVHVGPRDDGFWTRAKASAAQGEHPKKGCCMTAVAHKGKVYLYGGGMIESFYQDVYEMTLATGVWTKLDIDRSNGAAPAPTLSHTAVVHNDTMVVFGGMGNFSCINTVYSLPLTAPPGGAPRRWSEWTCPSGDAPSARKGHAACVWNGRMYVFMGADFRGFCLSDIWYFDLNTHVWIPVASADDIETVKAAAPKSRTGHSVAVVDGKAYIFGGMHQAKGAPHQWLRDMWMWDFATHTWTEVAVGDTGPPIGTPIGSPLTNAMATPVSPPIAPTGYPLMPFVYPEAGGLLSGLDGTEPILELESDESPTPASSDRDSDDDDAEYGAGKQMPPGRYSHVSWAAGRGIYVFGGDTRNCSKYFNDLWRFDLDAGEWEELHLPGDVPSPRSGHVVAVWAGCVYIFGGEKPLKMKTDEMELTKASVKNQVGYSNSVFSLPQFADSNTTLQDIAARYLLKSYGLAACTRSDATVAIEMLPLTADLKTVLLRLLPRNPSPATLRRRRGASGTSKDDLVAEDAQAVRAASLSSASVPLLPPIPLDEDYDDDTILL
eukprot:TRINITY_DN7800_c0_g1_i1.p1 TRINITY_DN7800_c0_g1~~TRINITY_DN7800_c0_g1_i1.p1  ORF type:complete len:548 (+),score=177.07 TRINITY_DN7800_c0_g1_i1:59-1702(+)